MIKKLKNISLKWKMILFYIVSFIVPLIIISILIYNQVTESMLEKIRYSSSQSYHQANDYLEYRILQAIYLSDTVAVNTYIKEYISGGYTQIHQQLSEKQKLLILLQSIEGNNQGLNIKLYIPEHLSGTKDGLYVFTLSEADGTPWYSHKEHGTVYFAPDIYLEEPYLGKKIALVRDIVSDTNYNQRLGVLRVDIDLKDIRETLQNAAITPNAVTYLINEENVIIAASDDKKMAQMGLDQSIPDVFSYDKWADSDAMMPGVLDREKVYFMRDKIQNTDWEMITIIPQSDMFDDVARVQGTVLILMCVFVILTSIGGTMIISWVGKRLRYLVNSMKMVQSGRLDIQLKNDCGDEIGVLYDNFNKMIERTADLMDEQYKMGRELKSAELKALQSQINPHFLYNTLDMINWLAHAGRTKEICSAVIALSKYYRLILNKGEDMLTIEKEVSHVNYYICIQNIRFPGKITFVQELEDSVKDGIVPKIILQPLVENAIQHGIFEKKGKAGTVTVRGFMDEEGIINLTVEDDGVGMDEETLCHVLDGTIRSSGSSYGVKNVDARIRLMFGETYGLSYESRPNVGTKVTLRFPKRTQEM